jgi:6-phosphogluconolactonase
MKPTHIIKNVVSSTLRISIVMGMITANTCTGPVASEKPVRFYVGSSDSSVEKSVFLCELDPALDKFSVIDSFSGAIVPSYLDFSPGRDFLYSIDDSMADTVTPSMSVTAFTVDIETDRIVPLNSQPSQGLGPCHVYCSKQGSYLFVANYNSGSVAAFPLDSLGRILPACSVYQSEGSGPVEGRQEGPHTHYVSLDPDENYLLSPDLGADKVLILAFDQETGTLSPNPEQPFFSLAPGSGPRHLVFHPDGGFLYVVNELNATVTACSYDSERGVLTELNTLSTVPDTYHGSKYPAAIRISPDGRYVYASIRGDMSSITVFRVEADGSLSTIQVMENVPGWPRDFNIHSSGRFLIAAGERSHEIELFRIDRNTGKLSRTGVKCNLPSPGCILFIPST